MLHKVVIDKLVHGGQGLSTLDDGRKVFVWNALPGEEVEIRLVKSRRDYAEGIAEQILTPSSARTMPRDEEYLSTSPWQIMDFDLENRSKQFILSETMSRAGVAYDTEITMDSDGQQWRYRNKMEYSFWADDNGIHTALFDRGTHRKRIVSGTSIARPEIDLAAQKICSILTDLGVRGSQLKTVVIRCNQQGDCVAALYVKDDNFPALPDLKGVCHGLVVNYSNPKSPASVLTKELYKYGDTSLQDTILDCPLRYDVRSFFQVNIPVFELALRRIKSEINQANIVDMYSGVGTIGLSLSDNPVLVEIDESNIEMARLNAAEGGQVIHASSESAADNMTENSTLIVDPPRAGLHANLVDKILQIKPRQVVYLSCNPSTQARDLALLQTGYSTQLIAGYNFFPKTPHIESLAILNRL